MSTKLFKKFAWPALMLGLGIWGLGQHINDEGILDGWRACASRFRGGSQVYFDEGFFLDGIYNTRVTAFDSGSRILFGGTNVVRGSTYPDDAGSPTVVAQSVAFKRGTHFGTLTNMVFGSINTPALILNPGNDNVLASQGRPIPTMNVNTSQWAGANWGLKQASQVHVHTGWSETERKSSACLTINPAQAWAFFSSRIGSNGTIHIQRSPDSRTVPLKLPELPASHESKEDAP